GGAPVEAPECPRYIGAGVVDLRSLPRRAAIGAALHCTDTHIPGERVTAQGNHRARCEWHLAVRCKERRANRNDETRAPTLQFVEAFDVVVHQLNPSDPFDALFPK